MSINLNWNINKYKEEHESEEQWQLRKAFMVKWKNQYPEERLACLAQVFINMEFLGCRYPSDVMQEVAKLSADIARQYRNNRKTKLQRTFISASDAAEDKVRGVKRNGGLIVESPQNKNARIAFVPQSNTNEQNDISDTETTKLCVDTLLQRMQNIPPQVNNKKKLKKPIIIEKSSNDCCHEPLINYTSIHNLPDFKGVSFMDELSKIKCLDVKDFNDRMFGTPFGHFVFVIRPWNDMINNLMSSCAACRVPLTHEYKEGAFTITINHQVIASVKGDKGSSRVTSSKIAWEKIRTSAVLLLVKEQWVMQNDNRISVTDMTTKKCEFGEPIEESVALNMMKLMGWEGGGLGIDSQGISEPIKPNLRMIRRAGLGHEASSGLHQLKRAGLALMRRRGIVLDADLVFASDFTPEERAVLHQCANQCGLLSKSYGRGVNRFLVVTNKLRPFSLVRALVQCGGDTPKYRVYIPATIGNTQAKRSTR